MLKAIKNIKSGPRELRQFGLTMAVGLTLLGGIMWWQGRNTYIIIIMAGFFLVCGLLWPVVLLPLQKGWMGLALVLGGVVSRAILILLFCFVVTPLGLILRLFGKPLLSRKPDPKANSYWQTSDASSCIQEQYERQF
jgi:hypothetical protein